MSTKKRIWRGQRPRPATFLTNPTPNSVKFPQKAPIFLELKCPNLVPPPASIRGPRPSFPGQPVVCPRQVEEVEEDGVHLLDVPAVVGELAVAVLEARAEEQREDDLIQGVNMLECWN